MPKISNTGTYYRPVSLHNGPIDSALSISSVFIGKTRLELADHCSTCSTGNDNKAKAKSTGARIAVVQSGLYNAANKCQQQLR